MRFKRGVDGGSGVLQTALVSYRKKFPWSLLRPFLQVTIKFVSFSFLSIGFLFIFIFLCYVVVSVDVVG